VKRIPVAAGVLLLGLVTAWPQDAPREVESTVDETVGIRQETQRQADAWAAERAELQARYHAARDQVTYLDERKHLLQQRAAALEERIAEFERRLVESRRLEESIQDTLTEILRRLEDWIAVDLPFLKAERAARVAALRSELAQPGNTPSEKLRRMLEALQIETLYGSGVEVYQEHIPLGTDSLFVDVFRLGRLSLFWRTPDGARCGEYDRAGGQWVELPGKYRRPIGHAIAIADRRRSAELVALPLGRIAP
jgi:hypothetical protein